jgi:hypothetical protein
MRSETILASDGFWVGNAYVFPFDLGKSDVVFIDWPLPGRHALQHELENVLTGRVSVPGVVIAGKVAVACKPAFWRKPSDNTTMLMHCDGTTSEISQELTSAIRSYLAPAFGEHIANAHLASLSGDHKALVGLYMALTSNADALVVDTLGTPSHIIYDFVENRLGSGLSFIEIGYQKRATKNKMPIQFPGARRVDVRIADGDIPSRHL